MKKLTYIFMVTIFVSFLLIFLPVIYREFNLVRFNISIIDKALPDFEIRSDRPIKRAIDISDKAILGVYEFQSETSSFPEIKSNLEAIWKSSFNFSSSSSSYAIPTWRTIFWETLSAFLIDWTI